jgi:hypothetical protein
MATKRKEYGIFYKRNGTWSKNPWAWDFANNTIASYDIAQAVRDAKVYLKSKVKIMEYNGKNWITPNNKLLINL